MIYLQRRMPRHKSYGKSRDRGESALFDCCLKDQPSQGEREPSEFSDTGNHALIRSEARDVKLQVLWCERLFFSIRKMQSLDFRTFAPPMWFIKCGFMHILSQQEPEPKIILHRTLPSFVPSRQLMIYVGSLIGLCKLTTSNCSMTCCRSGHNAPILA